MNPDINTENQVSNIEILLSCTDIAKVLKISRSTAYLLVQTGEIPSVRIGSSVMVKPKDLREFIESKHSSVTDTHL